MLVIQGHLYKVIELLNFQKTINQIKLMKEREFNKMAGVFIDRDCSLRILIIRDLDLIEFFQGSCRFYK